MFPGGVAAVVGCDVGGRGEATDDIEGTNMKLLDMVGLAVFV